MNQPDDNHTIQMILEGNTGAYSVIVDRYKDLVYSVVLKIVKNREEAEETAQDTFLKAYHALPGFKREAKFSTWLFRIAYNTAISKTRRKQVTTTAIDDKLIENYSTDEIRENLSQMDIEDRVKILQKAIHILGKDDQLLIQLFYRNRQSVEEIASITGLSDTNVKVKLHRIRKKLFFEMQSHQNAGIGQIIN
ncbi:MAG: sigma-70 family RNA polymerase sigma factor [Bacteroidales bacterium]|nr:sigma-70 family RNA polymerase sigma factor [Bacteroidales bacterium]MBK9356117.1 sigma-70 family RNA polymerase sigma factor [Bacteroidales bacterium]